MSLDSKPGFSKEQSGSIACSQNPWRISVSKKFSFRLKPEAF